MMRLNLVFLAAVLAISPNQSHACACCADSGFRTQHSETIDDWYSSQLSETELASEAFLFTDACGDECIKGIAEPKDSYQIEIVRDGLSWHVDLSHYGIHQGSLTLALPAQYEHFATDLSPDPKAHTPAPYHEFRHRVRIVGTGAFDTKGAVLTADFVLAGQSISMCDALQGTTHWFLDTDAPSARWRLYGDLVPPDP